MNMPGEMGPALADALLEMYPSMRVVFMTGCQQLADSLPKDALVVPKPFNSSELAEIITRALKPVTPV